MYDLNVPIWKINVTTGHPEFFDQEVIPAIQELDGTVTEIYSDIDCSKYIVQLPRTIIEDELQMLRDLDCYATWYTVRSSTFWKTPEM